jgi:hypothetical protein
MIYVFNQKPRQGYFPFVDSFLGRLPARPLAQGGCEPGIGPLADQIALTSESPSGLASFLPPYIVAHLCKSLFDRLWNANMMMNDATTRIAAEQTPLAPFVASYSDQIWLRGR